MDTLVANLVEAYRRDIERLDWMGPETRARALDKLAVFRPKIGYPPTLARLLEGARSTATT